MKIHKRIQPMLSVKLANRLDGRHDRLREFTKPKSESTTTHIQQQKLNKNLIKMNNKNLL